MGSLEETDQALAGIIKAPRVSLADIENAIAFRYDTTGADIVQIATQQHPEAKSLAVLSICLLVMKNGFTVIGKSAPASSENFNADVGKKFAYEDAVRQLWPLMGYALRERLSERAQLGPSDGAVGS